MKIFVITHKVSKTFAKSPIYDFLLVGSEKNKGLRSYYRDNDGKFSISRLNESFCELTGMYWMWKNRSDDITGLVHYRRYFVSKKTKYNQKKYILNEKQIIEDLKKVDIILPTRGNDEFKGEKAGPFFKRVHDPDVWENCRSIIANYHPEFLIDFEWFENQEIGYICNMFITRKEIFEEYCEWLFDILFKLNPTIDYIKYTNYNRRMIGFVGERLFNVWLHHKNFEVREYPIYMTDNEFKNKLLRKWRRLVFEVKKRLGRIHDFQ